jgi:hypothetical protein
MFCCALLAAGCANTLDEKQMTALRSSDDGIALISMTFNGHVPDYVQIVLIKADASGKFAYQKGPLNIARPIVFMRDSKKEPAQIQVSAGDYGIFSIREGKHQYNAKPIQSDALLSTSEKPIAAFSVRAGEVVDVGTLHITTTTTGQQTFFGRGPGGFVASVGPLLPHHVQNFSTRNPEVYQTRSQRMMKIPSAQVTQSSPQR